MLKDIEKEFICLLSSQLPTRRGGKRGPRPIPKEVLIAEIFKKFRLGLPWDRVEHERTCRDYWVEIQRRAALKKVFKRLLKKSLKKKPKKTIIDSTDIESYRGHRFVLYSGKYHNNCIKITVQLTDTYLPLLVRVDPGSMHDSKILNKMIVDSDILLSSELFLDKGYELYPRRRELKRRNVQVRMEMKSGVNKKRGPRFRFTKEDKCERLKIERWFFWLKSFREVKYCRVRNIAGVRAMLYLACSYYAFLRS